MHTAACVALLLLAACGEDPKELATYRAALAVDAIALDVEPLDADEGDTNGPDGDVADPDSAGDTDANETVDDVITPNDVELEVVDLDTSNGDTSPGDTSTGDTAQPDTSGPTDTYEPDTYDPDTYAPDTASPDTYDPDTYDPDTTGPDTYDPDTASPDTYEPDTTSPDTYEPDTYEPDTYIPDTYDPDTYDPDTYVPDTYVPDTYVPDTYVPDTSTPPDCTADADCDDGVECTRDTCEDGQCFNRDDPELCECNAQQPPPVAFSASVTLGKAGADSGLFLIPGDVPCPVVGGSVGASLTAKVSGTKSVATCKNDCKSSDSLRGDLSASIKICKETVTFKGGAGWKNSTQACVECNDNCAEVCGDAKCSRDDYDLTLATTYSKFYGIDTSSKKSRFTISFKCGASLGGGVNGSGNYFKKTRDAGYCDDCETCEGAGINLGFSGAASVGCNIDVKGPFGIGFQVGVPKAGTLDLGVYVGGSGQTGECGDGGCGHLGTDGKVTFEPMRLPCINLGWLGSYGIQCSGFLKWCAEAKACVNGGGAGACTGRCPNCRSFAKGFGCNVGSCN